MNPFTRERSDPLWNSSIQFDSLISNASAAAQKMSKSGFSLNDKKSRFSLFVEQRFRNTSSRPIATEEISKNWMELSNLNEVKFIVLIKETNNFDEINNFFMNKYWNKIGIFFKLMRTVLMRWKNWSDFKGLHSMDFREEDWSKIETLSLNSQPRFRNYRMKLIVLNDSRVFQDAESVRSGQSHVTSRPVSFHTSSNSWRNAKPFFWSAKPLRRAAKYLGHAWKIGKRFCKPRRVLCSTLSAGIESMKFQNRRAASLIHSGKEWETNTMSRSEMPVWTVSQKFCHLQWRRLFKELWCRPTTTADFGSSFGQIPYTNNLCLLEDEIQNWGICTCSQFHTEAVLWIKEVEMVDSVDDLKSSRSIRGTPGPDFEVPDAKIASALNRTIHHTRVKKKISLEDLKAQMEDRFLRGRQIAYLIYESACLFRHSLCLWPFLRQ